MLKNYLLSDFSTFLIFRQKHSLIHLTKGLPLTSSEFDPEGESIAAVDVAAMCVISDINTTHCRARVKVGNHGGIIFPVSLAVLNLKSDILR
mgnify:FL=1